jgi:hypothetical protein
MTLHDKVPKPKTKAASPALALWSWCPGPETLSHRAAVATVQNACPVRSVLLRSRCLELNSSIRSTSPPPQRMVMVPINDPVPGLL